MSNVVLYTTSNCPRCVAIKGRLNSYGIPHEVINLEDEADTLQEVKDAGYMVAPVLKVDDTYYGTPTLILDWIKMSSKAAVA